MKCTKPLAKNVKCPKCGMSLKPVKYVYVCAMHPKVTAREAGAKCWKCGMKLTKKLAAKSKDNKNKDHKHKDHEHKDHARK